MILFSFDLILYSLVSLNFIFILTFLDKPVDFWM